MYKCICECVSGVLQHVLYVPPQTLNSPLNESFVQDPSGTFDLGASIMRLKLTSKSRI